MNPHEQIEWIEQYLEGKLTGEELKAFEQKKADDPAFAAEVTLQREITEAMTENDVLDLSRKIRTIQHQKKQQSPGSGRIIFFRRLLQIAAGLALLVAVYFVYENFNQPAFTSQQLAARYFYPEDQIAHSATDRNRTEDEDTVADPTFALKQRLDALWTEVDTLYRQKNYSQSLEKFTAIQNLDPTFIVQSPDKFHFYQGLLLLLNDQPALAIPILKKVQTNFTEKADWYLALSYLKLGDTANAKKQLEKILSVGSHPFKESAKALSSDLNSLNPS